METVSKCRRVKTKSTGFLGKQEPDVKRTRLQHLVCLGWLGRIYTTPAVNVCLPTSISAPLWLLFCLSLKLLQKLWESQCCISTQFLVEDGWLLALPVPLGNHVAGKLLCDMKFSSAYLYSRPVYAFATFIEGSHCLPQWYLTLACIRITWRAC